VAPAGEEDAQGCSLCLG